MDIVDIVDIVDIMDIVDIEDIVDIVRTISIHVTLPIGFESDSQQKPLVHSTWCLCQGSKIIHTGSKCGGAPGVVTSISKSLILAPSVELLPGRAHSERHIRRKSI